MTTFKDLCNAIDEYETRSLAEGWNIDFYSEWANVKFTDIIADIRKYGYNDNSYRLTNELLARVSYYHTFGIDDVSRNERLFMESDALKIIDNEIGSKLHHISFGDKTPGDIITQWHLDEEYEREEEERQACIDYCASVAFNDGLTDSYEEARWIAEKCF